MAAHGLNMGGITGIYLEDITCAAPPPISIESIWTRLLPFDRNPFIMFNYCILRDCANHSPSKQQTFGLAYERAEHWNKCHREVLDYFLKADPVF